MTSVPFTTPQDVLRSSPLDNPACGRYADVIVMRIITKNDANVLGSSEAFRKRGFRLTGPRRLILEVVRRTDVHPTAEWVYRQVRRRLPRVSLGTVYRNLRLLVEEGIVKELQGGSEPGSLTARLARFDGNTSAHHHFTCSECGRIHDLAERVDRSIDRRIAARTGLEVSHHRIEFYGRCRACQIRRRRRARVGKRR